MTDKKQVLLVSSGLVHPSFLERFWLRRALRALPDVTLRQVPTLESLLRLPLAQVRGLVLYFHQETISPTALTTLERFVRQGGGLVAVHAATASFKEEDLYFEILGGRFLQHGPVGTFQIAPVSDQDEIFGSIPAFEVRDELYVHEYDAENRVHFYAEVDGERQPMVWTRSYGKGRVVYSCPGHCVSTIRHPAVHDILRRGLAWACGERGA
ncbi:MAG: ThuA domain-containing protein [Anaerolineae bacterium]|jgi:type 1 glutamine amidotransferase